MCTLTFWPISKDHFLLGSNRDVTCDRAQAVYPRLRTTEGQSYVCPIDPVGGGTWLFSSNERITAVLLNGGFRNHESSPPYRKSRGRIMMEFIEATNKYDFIHSYDADGIEPFTLVFFDHRIELWINQWTWDGKQSHYHQMDGSKPRIWSSSTLYTEEQQQARIHWFKKFFSGSKEFDYSEVETFHLDELKHAKAVPILLDTPTHRTVSFSFLEIDKTNLHFKYIDWLDKYEDEFRLNYRHRESWTGINHHTEI